jgi:glycine cleavage system regulatory protein
MARAVIDAGVCGHITEVETEVGEKFIVKIKISSSCEGIRRLAAELSEVDALQEISFRKTPPEILAKGAQFCSHASCPVPAGIIKAVEVAAGLALPKDVSIKLEK